MNPKPKKTPVAWIAAAAVGAALLLHPTGTDAQVAWESPLFIAPEQPVGFGAYLVDPHPGSGIGGLVTWRSGTQPARMGFRVGIAEGFAGDLSGYGGVDVSASLYRATQEFPLDVLWVSGIGLGAGDHVLLSVPLGVTLGRALTSEGVRFTPYATPRVVLDGHLGRDAPGSSLDLEFVLDLGADISFQPGWAIRFGASVGGHEALAIGLAIPGG